MPSSYLFDADYILPFVLAHIQSIEFESQAGLTLRPGTLDSDLWDDHMDSPPLAALFPKAIPLQRSSHQWKLPNTKSQPCLMTTAYGIQVMLKTSRLLLEHPQWTQSLSIPSTFIEKMVTQSILQMDYCMEMQEPEEQPETLSVLLEACAYMVDLTYIYAIPHRQIYWRWAQKLHIELLKMRAHENYTTMELCMKLRGLSIFSEYSKENQFAPEISETALEILSRQNRYGLLQKSFSDDHTLPLSSQFFAMDSLLNSCPFSRFDAVYEEVFSLFNTVYELGWNELAKYFAFSGKSRIEYSAFDVGTMLHALYVISRWTEGEVSQTMLLEITHHSYLKAFLDFYYKYYHQHLEDMALFEFPKPEGEGDNEGKSSESKWAPVFPDRISLRFPGPQIDFKHRPSLQLWQPLYLCSSILDIIQLEEWEETDSEHDQMMKMLLNLFL